MLVALGTCMYTLMDSLEEMVELMVSLEKIVNL